MKKISIMRLAVFFMTVALGFYFCAPREAFAHKTDVHGYHADEHDDENVEGDYSDYTNLTKESINLSGIDFFLNQYHGDAAKIERGAVREDRGLMRYRSHHYNPHTGASHPLGGRAIARAKKLWDRAGTAFEEAEKRWRGDATHPSDQGSMHLLGRTLHLLQDMAAVPHVHASLNPRRFGHGWVWKYGPGSDGGLLDGYYSDFEEKWSPSSPVYAGWSFPEAQRGLLLDVGR